MLWDLNGTEMLGYDIVVRFFVHTTLITPAENTICYSGKESYILKAVL